MCLPHTACMLSEKKNILAAGDPEGWHDFSHGIHDAKHHPTSSCTYMFLFSSLYHMISYEVIVTSRVTSSNHQGKGQSTRMYVSEEKIDIQHDTCTCMNEITRQSSVLRASFCFMFNTTASSHSGLTCEQTTWTWLACRRIQEPVNRSSSSSSGIALKWSSRSPRAGKSLE